MKNANRFASGIVPCAPRPGSSNPRRATRDRPRTLFNPPCQPAPSSSANYLLIYLYVHGVPREIYGTGRRPIFVSLERSSAALRFYSARLASPTVICSACLPRRRRQPSVRKKSYYTGRNNFANRDGNATFRTTGHFQPFTLRRIRAAMG